ncbi:MAG TPA: calcium-binding protein [Tepidisphaeraceae bacterium]|nr:calcium-binding protein [Tepidisphaeraceae bacterium]
MIRTAIEVLETRTLFAADAVGSAALDDGALVVNGTRGSDRIEISVNADDTTRLDVVINGRTAGTFAMTDVTAGVRADGGNGNDTISVDAAISIAATLRGGNGRDTLTGGSGDDRLEGGNGKDGLNGASGDDDLLGGNGSDALDGGGGADKLAGGRGKDRVTGGDGDDTFHGDAASEVLDKADDESVAEKTRGRH